MIRIRVDPQTPDQRAIERAAEVLRGGGLAAIPTDTLYGLAVPAFDADAVARVYRAKGRGSDRALPLVAASTLQVVRRFGPLPPMAARLAERFWPGPLTLLLRVPPDLPPDVTGGLATVGVRVPAHLVTTALCGAAGGPLTATSANVSGQPPTDDPDVVERALGSTIDLLVDAGRTPGGPPSTIVDTTGQTLRLVRAGAVSWEEVEACVRLA